MNKSRFIISLLTVVLFSTAAWGEILSPTLDVLYRSKSDKSHFEKWDNQDTPRKSDDKDVFECKWSANLFAIQRYEIANFATAKTLTLTLSLGATGANNHAAVWNFPYEMPESVSYDATKRAQFFSNVETVTSKTINDAAGSFSNQLAISACSENTLGTGKWVFTIDAGGLKPAGYTEDGKAIIQLLITSNAPNAAGQVKYYTNYSSNDASLRPKLDVTYGSGNLQNPITEINYRFNQNGNWNDNNFPKLGENTATVETNYSGRLYVIEQFAIEDYSPEKIYTLTLTKESQNNSISIWDYPYQTPTQHDNNLCASIINQIESVAGGTIAVDPAVAPTKDPIQTKTLSGSTWTFTIEGYKLTPISWSGATARVSILLTGPSNSKYYSIQGDNKPTLVYSGEKVESLYKTGSTFYTDFADALAALGTSGDTLEMFTDATLASQLRKDNKNVTILGNNHRLTNSYTAAHALLTASGSIYLQDLTLYGGNLDSKHLVEAGGSTFSANNVTFKNVINSNDFGIICSKGTGTTVLDNVTFEGCTNTGSNQALLFIGNFKVTIKNSLTFTNCTGNDIYVEQTKNFRVESLSSDLNITLDAARSDNSTLINGATTQTLNVAPLGWYLDASESSYTAKRTAITFNDGEDNATTLYAKDGYLANVTLNRTVVRNDNYSTFCAPFAISRSALEAQLGTTEVLRYKYTSVVNDVATLVFDDDVEDLEAGVPYLIKPESGDNVTSMTFNGVTIDKTSRPAEDSHYQFIPLFSQKVVSNTGEQDKSVVYLGAGNQLYWAGATCTIKGFRAYLKAKNPESPAMKAVKRMVIDRYNTPTGIENTSAKLGESQKILRDGQIVIIRDGIEYNLMGQKVK